MIFKFEIIKKSNKSNARVGKVTTNHGIYYTPTFIPVGTNGAIKCIDSVLLKKEVNPSIIFCNTYHLLIRIGFDNVKNIKGIHNFINRDQPIITDSGGFQVFSLSYGGVTTEIKKKASKYPNSVLKVSEEGVLFRSYIDGKKKFLTPENSIEFQNLLGSDIVLPLDELLPFHIEEDKFWHSFYRTHRWQQRSLDMHKKLKSDQGILGIIHGNVSLDARRESSKIISKMGFDGLSIGGSLGTLSHEMFNVIQTVKQSVSDDQYIHLLGIGDIKSIEKSIPFGIDSFDSSFVTKLARHGIALVDGGKIDVKKSKYSVDDNVIDCQCRCYTCKNYKICYIHHLFKAKEVSGCSLLSIHNLNYMMNKFDKYRNMIMNDCI